MIITARIEIVFTCERLWKAMNIHQEGQLCRDLCMKNNL